MNHSSIQSNLCTIHDVKQSNKEELERLTSTANLKAPQVA
jgi:hypothetical protein